jgi:hypothetical protein
MRTFVAITVIAAAIGLAVAMWRGYDATRTITDLGRADQAQSELQALRSALASARSENAAYRAELDRLLSRFDERAATQSRTSETSKAGKPGPAASETAGPAAARFTELAGRYRDRLSRAALGDAAAADEAYAAAIELLRGGELAFPALRDAYLSASDARIKAVMLRSFLVTQGSQAQDFIASQLESETDPDLRDALITKAERMTTPSTATIFRGAFLNALAAETDAETRAAAVRGLRYVPEDAEVDAALLAAAKDPSDDVRLAAMQSLAAKPARHNALADLVRAETNDRVRAIGECRMLLAEPAQ